ncbi:hypothetical protein GCM10027590_35850 [Nocardiopsis nanhaiensis]
MTREALDGDDLEARSGDGHNRAAGKEDTPANRGTPTREDTSSHKGSGKGNPHQSRQPQLPRATSPGLPEVI